MAIYVESSLATSEIFNELNKISGGEGTLQKAMNLAKTAKRLTNTDIEAAYISVRQVTDSLTRAAIKAFDEERIILLYNNDPSLAVTQTLPFITFKIGGKNKTFIFVDRWISISRSGVMTITPAILRDLLIGALVANGIRNDYTKLSTSPYLQKVTMEIYTKFVVRILNREFSIQSDKQVHDIIRYWINKFFLLRIFGANTTAESIETLSTAHFLYMDELKADEVKRQYTESDPQVFSELIELVKTASPRMKSLSLGIFYSDWVNYYHIPSMLAIDNIEYLLFMIIALQSGNNIISISASDIVKECKNIKSFREELLKLI